MQQKGNHYLLVKIEILFFNIITDKVIETIYNLVNKQ